MSFSLLFCYTSLCHCHYYFICSTKDKAGDTAASLYEMVYASSCMTTEREPKGKPDEQSEESPYKCSICDRAFSDRAEFEQHQNNMHRDQQSI